MGINENQELERMKALRLQEITIEEGKNKITMDGNGKVIAPNTPKAREQQAREQQAREQQSNNHEAEKQNEEFKLKEKELQELKRQIEGEKSEIIALEGLINKKKSENYKSDKLAKREENLRLRKEQYNNHLKEYEKLKSELDNL